MHFLRLLAPAALVALASAQFLDDNEQGDIVAREAPGLDDLGVFVRELDDDLLDLKAREAEADSELLLSSDSDISLSAREADMFGDYDSLIALEQREADPEAEADANPEAKKKRKHKKKGKKSRKARARARKARARKMRKLRKQNKKLREENKKLKAELEKLRADKD